MLSWSGFVVALEHHHFDTFLARAGKGDANTRLEGEAATFTLDAAGDAAGVRFLGRTFKRAKKEG